MNVCHVTPKIFPNQSAVALIPDILEQWLRKNGNSTSLITYAPEERADIQSRADAVYVPRYAAPSFLPWRMLPWLQTFSFVLRTCGNMIQSSDIVHFHGYTPLVPAGMLLCLLYKKPSVFTLYGTEIWSYRKKPFLNLFASIINSKVNVSVFYSKGLMEHASRLGLNPRHKTFIYPPVPSYFFAPPSKNENDNDNARDGTKRRGKYALLNTKGCFPVSQPRTLIQAMPFIGRQIPEAELTIIGGGPLENDMKALSKQLNVSDRVHFMESLPNEKLVSYYRAAGVFVLSSTLESYGNVIVESLSCGTPVVATATVGAQELKAIFPDDISLVPVDDFQSLADAAVNVIKSESKVSEKTKQMIASRFCVESFCRSYDDVYKQAMKGK